MTKTIWYYEIHARHAWHRELTNYDNYVECLNAASKDGRRPYRIKRQNVIVAPVAQSVILK